MINPLIGWSRKKTLGGVPACNDFGLLVELRDRMRIVFLGDILGKAGREAVISAVPTLRRQLDLDLLVVNGENAAHGFGLTSGIADALFEAGVDVITTGNHVWDQREMLSHIEEEPRIVRPLNYPEGTPGRGVTVVQGAHGQQIMVINAMARLFMDPLDDPFAAVDAALEPVELGRTVDAVLIDFHGEASSEKQAFGHYFDGRASLIVGTHTHVPTADAQVLPGGTAYQTDAGMCGDYNSVIGMQIEAPIQRFTRKTPGERLNPAGGVATVCGVFAELDPATGLAKRVEPIRMGGRLLQAWPDLHTQADAAQ